MKFGIALTTSLVALTLVYCSGTPTSTACKSDAECLTEQKCDTASGACMDKNPGGGADTGGAVPPDAGEPSDAASPGPDAGSNPGADAGRGCTATNECAPGQACDVAAQTCVNTCGSAQPCNGGCCDNTGKCRVTADNACGTTSCSDCTTGTTNHKCVADTGSTLKCGCATQADCAAGEACNKTTHLCSASCGTATTDCREACCTNGTCANSNAACGVACTNCAPTSTANNKACLSGRCGCNSNTDCASGVPCDLTTHLCSGCKSDSECSIGQSCNTTTGVCGTDCSVSGTCNGACCPAGAGARTCINNANACGTSCTNCSVNSAAPACLSSIYSAGHCGCRTSSDCPFNQACDFLGKCGTTCNPSFGINCNGGCCSANTCVAGDLKTACGSNGGDCFACGSICCWDSCGVAKFGCP